MLSTMHGHIMLTVVIMDGMVLKRSCDCSKCDFESLFIECMYNGIKHTSSGIYRHTNWNVSSLETIFTKPDVRKNANLVVDMNIDLIKPTYDNVVSCMSTMMLYRYLPYVTLPNHITQFSTNCIDIAVKKSHKEKVLSTLYGTFNCDISDHQPCFTSH